MQYIVLDMEWNQAQTPDKVLREPVHLVGEIVQIGAVKLDESFRLVDTFEIYITPVFYKRMNWRIAKLTGITNEDIRGGYPFKEALEQFCMWCGDKYSFITWGRDDIPMLRDNIRIHGMNDEWIPAHYNIQPIFDSQITKENRQCSLMYAMEKLEEVPYREHDALNDALNTAVICTYLDMENGIKEYERFKKTRNTAKQSGKDATVKHFASRALALSDKECKRLSCPSCGKKTVSGNWVHQSGDKYIAQTACKCGKEYFMRMILRKNDDSTVRVGRNVYPLDDERREYYLAISERNRRRKKRKYGGVKTHI